MSIRKRLIIYKVPRHENGFSVTIKYGYYSDKIRSDISLGGFKPRLDFGRKSEKRFIQKLNLTFSGHNRRDLDALSGLSRFHSIKTCFINVDDKSAKKNFTNKAFHTLFLTLKRVTHFEFQQVLLSEQHHTKTFKPLTLLPNLQYSTLPRYSYSKNPQDLEPLLQVLKLASKRRCWPKLQSFNIGPLSAQGTFLNREKCVPSLESLYTLLEFVQGLNECKNLPFNIHLALPYLNCEKSLEILDEISREMTSFLGGIQIAELEYCSKILETFQRSKNLRKVMIGITEQTKKKVDLSALNKLPFFQHLWIWVRNSKDIDLLSHSDIFTQVQTLSNLTDFTFDIHRQERPIEEINLDLAGTIRNMMNLKNLDLSFGRSLKEGNDNKDFKPLKNVWFEEVFTAIGERAKLKKLSFSMWRLRFENPKRLLSTFCESLRKLEQLSDLNLNFIDKEMAIEEEEIVQFCDSLGFLKNLYNLNISIACAKLQPKEALSELFSCFANNFEFLAGFNFRLEGVKVTMQAYQHMEKMLHKLRCLNGMNLTLFGQIEEGLDLPLFIKEMQKRMSGHISLVSK